MQFDKKTLEEFKSLYYEEFKVKLTDDLAEEYGNRLLQLIKSVYKNKSQNLTSYNGNRIIKLNSK